MFYEEVDLTIYTLLDDLRVEYFPDLQHAKIKVVFSLKKMTKGGRLCLGKIKKTSNLERFLSADDIATEGFDYVIFLDKLCWLNIELPDKERILRHELRHTYVEYKDDGGIVYRLVDHDINDFMAEITLNMNDPKWSARVGDLVTLLYEQKKDEEETGDGLSDNDDYI